MAEVFSELFAFHTTIATPAATPVDLWFRGLQLTGQGGGFYCSLNLTFNLFQTGTIQPFNSDVVLPSMNDSVQYNCPQQ